ncbi:glycosyltransferase family 4 protein [Gordonia alkanivorans]|uniref:glycosyltransferase family 4 protein n=1 Tax=Gordonia alkanivorans TaxID=84096 RepID=UPI00244BD063|nr:glycosyltransferase family 4 protein [Gordonia alkanivorans]MDH3022465.1 glycosyltransferase family 4 protein [Gordonia alkanivorans]
MSIDRVTIVSLNFAPEPTGISVYSTDLARLLLDLGYRVEVVTGIPHYPAWKRQSGYRRVASSREVFDGSITVRRLPHFVPGRPRMFGRILMEATFAVRLLFARLGSPDLVICTSPSLLASVALVLRSFVSRPASRFRLAVWVQDLYGVGAAESMGASGRLVQWIGALERFVFQRADRIAVIHERFRRVVTSFSGRADVDVVRNWTHISNVRADALDSSEGLDPVEVRARLGWPAGPVVLHAGNMGAKQGLDVAVDAAREEFQLGGDSHVTYVLMGDGNSRRDLELHGQGLENLLFMDPVPSDLFFAALQSADVLLVTEKPGVSEMAVPSKLTSYFAAARPVVASVDSGGITAGEVESAGAGIIVEAGSPGMLCTAIRDLLSDPQRMSELGQSGEKYCVAQLSRGAAQIAVDKWVRSME